MTEWGVVGVVVMLVGLIAAIVGPMIKLNTAITTLTVTMRHFEGNFNELTSKNQAGHERIWKELSGHRQELAGHETRITKLEDKP